MSWMNFSDAEEQTGDLIPNKTPVKVHLKIRPGGYDDQSQGWTGGYATKGSTGSIYLDGEFTIMGGKYNKRKVWSLIGLHSPKGDKWAAMGRSFIRAMLESARGVAPSDASDAAMKARAINSFADLDGMEFTAMVEVQKADPGSNYDDKNVIQTVIPVTHKDYQALMSGAGTTQTMSAGASQLGSQAKSGGTPAWMQQ